MEWSVLVEVRRPAETDPTAALIPDDPRYLDAFLDAVSTVHGVVGILPDSWSARITVDASGARLAVDAAAEILRKAAANAGLPDWPFSWIEVISTDVQAEQLEWQPFPDVVGSQEVLAILGVSKQRLSQLRKAGRFPQPLLELAATPLWLRAAVEAFAAVERHPGRPANVVDVDMDGILGAGAGGIRHPEQG